MILLFGLITIPEYVYRFKLSIAKIEIMSLDLPRVEYIEKDKKKAKANSNQVDYEAIKKNEEALKESLERRKNREWKKINLSDLTTNIPNT
ncbi:hypothetical protein [uncultured Dysgonomonas sp.]|nr:hypothetical protein [uncultured Dysgonomonas sp.]